jgi:hypothetical protein
VHRATLLRDIKYFENQWSSHLQLDTSVFVDRIPVCLDNAGIAQLVEHNLAKVGVASSNLVSRSNFLMKPRSFEVFLFQGT